MLRVMEPAVSDQVRFVVVVIVHLAPEPLIVHAPVFVTARVFELDEVQPNEANKNPASTKVPLFKVVTVPVFE